MSVSILMSVVCLFIIGQKWIYFQLFCIHMWKVFSIHEYNEFFFFIQSIDSFSLHTPGEGCGLFKTKRSVMSKFFKVMRNTLGLEASRKVCTKYFYNMLNALRPERLEITSGHLKVIIFQSHFDYDRTTKNSLFPALVAAVMNFLLPMIKALSTF